MGNVTVTGVSGALGTRLAAVLAAGENVERVVGVDQRPLAQSSPKLTFLPRKLQECDPKELFRGADTVVHLDTDAGAPMLRRLLDAAADCGVRTFVTVSSTAVFGAWPSNPVPIPDGALLRPNPGFEVVNDLAEQERVAAEFRSRNSSMSVAVMRLALVVGADPERPFTAALTNTDWYRHGGSSRPMQFVHIEDAVEAVHLAVTEGLEGAFNVAPVDFVSEPTARAIAGGPPRPALPQLLARVSNRVLWRSRRLAHDFDAVALYLEHPWVVSSDRLRAAGWAPSFTSEEALVADANPSRWNSLRPDQKRNIVNAASLTMLGGGAATAIGCATFLWRRYRR